MLYRCRVCSFSSEYLGQMLKHIDDTGHSFKNSKRKKKEVK